VTLLVDGVAVREQSFEAGRREPILFADFDARLTKGQHRITLRVKGGQLLAVFNGGGIPQHAACIIERGCGQA
jgi:hypothetical protein